MLSMCPVLKDNTRLSVPRRLLLLGANLATLIALTWVLRVPFRDYPIYDSIGYVCAVLCLSGLFVVLITSYWLGFAKKHDWSPAYCQRQGFYMAMYLIFLFLSFGHNPRWLAALLGLMIGVLSGLVLRRRAYPAFADEQFYASKKLPRIFPS